MAKRSRGASRPGQTRPAARRPGQRPAARSSAAATTDALRPTTRPLVDDAVFDDLEVEPDRPAARVRRDAAPAQPLRTRGTQTSGLLAQRAAEEYAYVARDVRHIGVVGGGMFLVLIALFVIDQFAHFV